GAAEAVAPPYVEVEAACQLQQVRLLWGVPPPLLRRLLQPERCAPVACAGGVDAVSVMAAALAGGDCLYSEHISLPLRAQDAAERGDPRAHTIRVPLRMPPIVVEHMSECGGTWESAPDTEVALAVAASPPASQSRAAASREPADAAALSLAASPLSPTSEHGVCTTTVSQRRVLAVVCAAVDVRAEAEQPGAARAGAHTCHRAAAAGAARNTPQPLYLVGVVCLVPQDDATSGAASVTSPLSAAAAPPASSGGSSGGSTNTAPPVAGAAREAPPLPLADGDGVHVVCTPLDAAVAVTAGYTVRYERWLALRHGVALSLQPVFSSSSASDELTCVVCMSDRPTVCLLPCGHLCLCGSCMEEGGLSTCPVCRAPFTGMLIEEAEAAAAAATAAATTAAATRQV
ncbi:RING-HC finger protein, partial [archaeon]